MDVGTIRLNETNIFLAKDCYRTTKSWEKIRGLLGRPRLNPSSAILFDGSDCIHTSFMQYSVDILYLDKDLKIVKTVNSMKPWRLSFCLDAFSILVLSGGAIRKQRLTSNPQLTWSFRQNLW